MSAIAITGVGGSLGQRLVSRLVATAGIDRVVGIDRSPPEGVSAPRFSFHLADPGSDDLTETLRGIDVVIHLGGMLEPARDDATLRIREVDAPRRVAQAAAAAGVPRLVLTSASLAYGAHPDNDVPLTEDSPLRAVPGFAASEHAVEVERWLARWRVDQPDLSVTVLRFALLAGPGLDTVLTRAFEAPRIPAVRGHRPPLQFLHPTDAVAAIVHAVTADLDGAYNVSADGWLSYDEVTAILGRRSLEVPEEVAYSGAAGVYALRLGDLPPGLVALYVHPCVMSNARLTATGWAPRHSNRDAVAALATEHAAYVTIGRVRARSAHLARATALVAVLLGIGVGRLLRARRRRAEDPGSPTGPQVPS